MPIEAVDRNALRLISPFVIAFTAGWVAVAAAQSKTALPKNGYPDMGNNVYSDCLSY